MTTWPLMHPLFLVLSISFSLLDAQIVENPTAFVPASWTNNGSAMPEVEFSDGSTVRSILVRGNGIGFSCGFICSRNSDTFLFAIMVVSTNMVDFNTSVPRVVWSANRDTLVTENSTLKLTRDGDLVLQDAVGKVVWSTNTSGKSVVGMSLTETGNLVLFNSNNETIWQSFDHPTDTLLLGQKLLAGQRLTANASATNSGRGPIFLSVTVHGLSAFIGYDPPQKYYNGTPLGDSHLKFVRGGIEFSMETTFKQPQTIYSMRLEADGNLVYYQHEGGALLWYNIFKIDECNYPTVCGNYGICTNGMCYCPHNDINSIVFKPLDSDNLRLGCTRPTPLSCQTPQYHSFLPLQDVSYFNYVDPDAAVLKGVDIESCKQACLEKCSCKAALFRYGRNLSKGSCFLPSQLFSLINIQDMQRNFNSSAFLKVQISATPRSSGLLNGSRAASSPHSRNKTGQTQKILGSLGASFGTFVIIGICLVLLRKRKNAEGGDDESFNQAPEMPVRFSHEDLKVATADFKRKLGAGGFGSVFEGTLANSIKVAVKRLDGSSQGKKEFFAEVESIGSIHHVNLVRLIGFCADKSRKLLVYEYMSNGSLDKWIFRRDQNPSLDWKTREKIILDVAKGLSYLHEDCRRIIAHLDIKPENILLDENFNAKVSDFGLAKMIDRDLSHVMTRMRGTRGYLAPEWLSSVITEKVDVYSFGVVVLEIVCGRRNLDHSQPEESNHLVSLLKRKAEDDQLVDIIDKHSEDMQCHIEEAVKMLRIAMRCLRHDCSRRPSMSTVVQVLDGVIELEPTVDYDFLTPTPAVPHNEWTISVSSPLSVSVLSGLR